MAPAAGDILFVDTNVLLIATVAVHVDPQWAWTAATQFPA